MSPIATWLIVRPVVVLVRFQRAAVVAATATISMTAPSIVARDQTMSALRCFGRPQPVMGFGRDNEGEQDEIAGRGHEQKGCNRVGRDEAPEIIERGQIEQNEQSQGIDRGESRYAGAPSQPVQR